MDAHTVKITYLLLLAFFCLCPFFVKSQDIDTLIFTGDSLTVYEGQTVFFDQDFYVVNRTSSYYLYLSPERLREPLDIAIEGTVAYDSAVEKIATKILKVYARYIGEKDTIRLGAVVHGLQAQVVGARYVKTTATSLNISNNRPTSIPDVGEARLILCEANLKNYYPVWQGTHSAATSEEDFYCQKVKLTKAFLNINADIYALTELQQGRIALETIVQELNVRTSAGLYAYVDDGDAVDVRYYYYNNDTISNIKVGFIYRTDKVRPILHLGHPYPAGSGNNPYTTNTLFHAREYVQCFEELATGERFTVSMNHFQSKASASGTVRMNNARTLASFLDTQLANDYYHDPDVLIIGDFNSYMQEEPVQYLDDIGYDNLLVHTAPQEYSYVYSGNHNAVGYLDHVFASPSLSMQITGAAPYHINVDESATRYYYTAHDTSMYCYSDHDPLIIGLSLHSDVRDSCIEYMANFLYSLDDFIPISLQGDSIWHWHDNYLSAYIGGHHAGMEEDYLVSPYYDLTSMDSAKIYFNHAMGYGDVSQWENHCKLLISSDFYGDITLANWDTLIIPNMPTEPWKWQQTVIPVPYEYCGQRNIVIAFRYTMEDEEDAPVWEFNQFLLRGFYSSDTTISDTTMIINNFQEKNCKIYAKNQQIIIENTGIANVDIYDLAGRRIYYRTKMGSGSISVSRGIYIVRIGEYAQKVVVQ